ncbi:hypothetical protein T484DRAFT_1923401, partial [Baffinella frigidus]
MRRTMHHPPLGGTMTEGNHHQRDVCCRMYVSPETAAHGEHHSSSYSQELPGVARTCPGLPGLARGCPDLPGQLPGRQVRAACRTRAGQGCPGLPGLAQAAPGLDRPDPARHLARSGARPGPVARCPDLPARTRPDTLPGPVPGPDRLPGARGKIYTVARGPGNRAIFFGYPGPGTVFRARLL